MHLQSSLADLIVVLCGAYALWTLVLPAAARQRASRALLRLPLPGGLKQRLHRSSLRAAEGGCAACDKAAPASAREAPRPIRVVRRKPD